MDKTILEQMYMLGNSNASPEVAKMAVEEELDQYRAIVGASEELKKCKVETHERNLRQILRKGLTVDQSLKLVYIMPLRGIASHVLSVDGELFLAFKSGRLLDFKTPYREGDSYIFEFKVNDGESGRWEKAVYDYSFFDRLKRFGGKSKFYGTSIDTIDSGFAKAKVIRHSIKRLGANPFHLFSTKQVKDRFQKTGLVDAEEMEQYMDGLEKFENNTTKDIEL
jgi:hypothetical protein